MNQVSPPNRCGCTQCYLPWWLSSSGPFWAPFSFPESPEHFQGPEILVPQNVDETHCWRCWCVRHNTTTRISTQWNDGNICFSGLCVRTCLYHCAFLNVTIRSPDGPLQDGLFLRRQSHRHRWSRTWRDSAATSPLKAPWFPPACPSLLALGCGTEVKRALQRGLWGPHFEQWELPAILPVLRGILPLPPHIPGRIHCVLHSALLYGWEVRGKASADLFYLSVVLSTS